MLVAATVARFGVEGLLLTVLMSGLMLTLPLAADGEAVRVLVRKKEVRYYVARGGELLAVQFNDDYVDRGVSLLLAELAGRH